MDLNKAMIIGRLTRDPEVRTTPQGATVCSFGMATNFMWTDQQGQRQKRVEYHNIVTWRKLAEICSQYLKKASKIYIEGRLQTREWQGQDGVKRQRTEIVADNMIMLDSIGGASGASRSAGNFQQSNQPVSTAPIQSAAPTQSAAEPSIPGEPTIVPVGQPSVTPSSKVAVGAAPSVPKKEGVSVEDIPF